MISYLLMTAAACMPLFLRHCFTLFTLDIIPGTPSTSSHLSKLLRQKHC